MEDIFIALAFDDPETSYNPPRCYIRVCSIDKHKGGWYPREVDIDCGSFEELEAFLES